MYQNIHFLVYISFMYRKTNVWITQSLFVVIITCFEYFLFIILFIVFITLEYFFVCEHNGFFIFPFEADTYPSK